MIDVIGYCALAIFLSGAFGIPPIIQMTILFVIAGLKLHTIIQFEIKRIKINEKIEEELCKAVEREARALIDKAEKYGDEYYDRGKANE